MAAIILDVDFIGQLTEGLCGAACAQMILHAKRRVARSAAAQKKLWKDIKANTAAPSGVLARRHADDDSACEAFEGKICERCRSGSFCWCAFPTVLKATLLQRDPALGVRVVISASQDAINEKIVACLTRGVAPIMLVNSGRHWVVVKGRDDGSEQPIKILDPAFHAQIAFSLEAWNTRYLDKVDCGKFKNRHVLIGRASG